MCVLYNIYNCAHCKFSFIYEYVRTVLYHNIKRACTCNVWYMIVCVKCVLHWLCSVYASVLSRLFLGCAAPPIVQIHPPISVSEAAAPPIRVIACKANLYSIIITKQLYTCKYTAINCTIVTLAEDRGWIPD